MPSKLIAALLVRSSTSMAGAVEVVMARQDNSIVTYDSRAMLSWLPTRVGRQLRPRIELTPNVFSSSGRPFVRCALAVHPASDV